MLRTTTRHYAFHHCSVQLPVPQHRRQQTRRRPVLISVVAAMPGLSVTALPSTMISACPSRARHRASPLRHANLPSAVPQLAKERKVYQSLVYINTTNISSCEVVLTSMPCQGAQPPGRAAFGACAARCYSLRPPLGEVARHRRGCLPRAASYP